MHNNLYNTCYLSNNLLFHPYTRNNNQVSMNIKYPQQTMIWNSIRKTVQRKGTLRTIPTTNIKYTGTKKVPRTQYEVTYDEEVPRHYDAQKKV
jgi:hypothetical protein